jgi:predicted RNase H-like HicB family nuclease
MRCRHGGTRPRPRDDARPRTPTGPEDRIEVHLTVPTDRGAGMHGEFTAVVKQDGDWWTGWIEELPGVNCQEATREELLDTLAETLKEALELNRQDALAMVAQPYFEETIVV